MAESQIVYRVAAHLSSKGDLAKSMAAKAAAVSGLSQKLDMATSKAMAWGSAQTSAVMSSVASMGKFAAAAGGAGLAAGVALAAVKGADFNVSMEKAQNTIAGTLQMYNHSAGAIDQMGTNIKVAGASLQKLMDIADSAPGEFGDIRDMFSNMLPGARSVTGEMERIMTLSQNLALFTPTLTGGDFKTSGAQLGRILTGSAGAEMDTWKRMAPMLLEAGHELNKAGGGGKIFAESLNEANEKMTMEFNKLAGSDRLALVEKVFSRGGPALAKMYSESWEGASSTFVSGWKKIAGAATRPMFLSLKDALVKAGADENAVFGKKNLAKLMTGASLIGGVLNRTFVKVLDAAGKGIDYLANNWETVANKVYHAMQIGAGAIKAAFAFGLARMIAGSAVLAAGMASRAAGGVVKGAKGVYGAGKGIVKGVSDAASGLKKVMAVFTDGSPITRAMGLVTMISGGFMTLATGALMLIPMVLIAGVVFGALAVALTAVAGVAAYVISKWDEIVGSIRQGFAEGTLTLRPLVEAAMLLWEKLKALGGAFMGGTTGAGMMQWAINMAVTVVEGLTSAIVIMAKVAAGMVAVVGKLANAYDAVFGETDEARFLKRTQEFEGSGMSAKDAWNRADAERRNGFLSAPKSFGDEAMELSDKISDAADRMEKVGLKDLDFKGIEDLTKKADDYMKSLTAGDEEAKKKKKGPAVNIGTLVQQFDLRGEDPDRAMVAWVEPIERLARTPGGSALDMGGF